MGIIKELKVFFERTLSISSKKNIEVQPAAFAQKDENEKRLQEDVDKLRPRIEARVEERRRSKENKEQESNKEVTNEYSDEFEYKILNDINNPEDGDQGCKDECNRRADENHVHVIDEDSKNYKFNSSFGNNDSSVFDDNESENPRRLNEVLNKKADGEAKDLTLKGIPADYKGEQSEKKKRKKKSCFKERGPVPSSVSKLKAGPYHDQCRLVNPITFCGGQVFEKTSHHTYRNQQLISSNSEIKALNQSINFPVEPWTQCQLPLTIVDRPELTYLTVQQPVQDLELNSSQVLPSFSEGFQNLSDFAVALPESDISNQVVNVLENLNENEMSRLYECVDRALYIPEPNICSDFDFENVEIPFDSVHREYANTTSPARKSPELSEFGIRTYENAALDPAFASSSGAGLLENGHCEMSVVLERVGGALPSDDGSSPEMVPRHELMLDENAAEAMPPEIPQTPEPTFGPFNILTPPQSNETVGDNHSPATSHLQYSPRSDTNSCRLSSQSSHSNGEDADEEVAKKKPNMKYFKQRSQKLTEHYSTLPCCRETGSCVEFLEKKEQLLTKEHRTKMAYAIHAELSLKQIMSLLYYQVIPKLGRHEAQSAGSAQLNVDYAVLLMCGRRLLGSVEGRKMLLSEDCGLSLVWRAADVCARNAWVTRYCVWCVRRALLAAETPARKALWAPPPRRHDTDDTYKGDNLVTYLAQRGDAYAASLAAVVARDPHETPLFDIEHKNADGYTALQLACVAHRSSPELRAADTVHVLTTHAGASLTTKDMKVGNTAVHLAVDSPHADLDLLLTLFLAVKNNKQGVTRKSLAYCPNNGGEKPIALARRNKGSATYPHHIVHFLERCRH